MSMVLLLGGCAPSSAAPVEILVAAASDLAGAMPELAAAFEAESGVRVVATLGSSGQLAQQTLQGAPVDVFLSADRGWVDRLEQAGRLEAGTRAVYANGVLVLLAGRETSAPPSVEALAREQYSWIALANPEHAPYGIAARQALASAGIHESVQSRLILAENVRQAVQFAETRSVDVSMAALSLMDSTRHRWTRVPPELHEPLVQTVAVIAGRPRTDAAHGFVTFLLGPDGREILRRYQFVLP